MLETPETAALDGGDAQEVTELATKAAATGREGGEEINHVHVGSNPGVKVDPEATRGVLSDQAKFPNAGHSRASMSADLAEAEC